MTLNQKGISIVSLVCSMALLALLLTALSSQLTVFLSFSQGLQCRIEIQETARFGMDNILKDAKSATAAVVSDGGRRLLLLRTNGSSVEYFADFGGVLRRNANDGSGAQPMSGSGLAPSKSELEFRQATDGLLQIKMNVQSWDNSGKRYSYLLESRIMLGER